jgi:hypothetical protein
MRLNSGEGVSFVRFPISLCQRGIDLLADLAGSYTLEDHVL